MESRNEILLAVREARRNMGDRSDFRVRDALDVLEGIAPFLDKEAVISMKCKKCDHYASASFPLRNDFWAVDAAEYCHSKEASFKNITSLRLAACQEYSRTAQESLEALAGTILEEDLRPAFAERKLYDRCKFASYSISFSLQTEPGRVCIDFGHMTEEGFACCDLRLYILRRLDPGFEAEASEKIAEALRNGPAMVVKASTQTRRQLDVDYVLEWIAKKRGLDIVYI